MRRILATTLAAMLMLGAAAGCTKSSGSHDEMAMAEDNGHGAHGGHEDSHGDEEASVQTKAGWTFSSTAPAAGSKTGITIQVTDEAGNPVTKFDINHEKEMHLIVVSKDLSTFNHIHPEHKGDGKFEVSTVFPAAGEYKLIADYMPAGGDAVSQSSWVTIAGDAAKEAAIEPDQTLTKTVDGVTATLSFDHLMADMELDLKFQLTDAKTKQPITDLEPYLGAVGHVVILSADTEQYLHVHPVDEKAQGPEAAFKTTFPESGLYKIWGQFQRGGQTFVIPFTVNVP